jgi:O-antigen ligase
MMICLVYLVWRADPAWTLSIGLGLSCFNGYWDNMGVPSLLSPDRYVLAGGLLAVLLRAPAVKNRPPLHLKPVHWLMIATILYAVCSAFASDTLSSTANVAAILERFGIIPFLFYFCGPVAFRTQKQRDVLLVTLLVCGVYWGLLALFQTLKIDALVWPKYILDPHVGIRPDRARGPFADPTSLGIALFACTGAAVIAYRRWRSPLIRITCAGIMFLGAAGMFFTLTRQVWLAGTVSAIIVALVTPGLRRWVVPTLAAGAVIVAATLIVLPAFNAAFEKRKSEQNPIYDRLNLDAAAIRAIEDHPLIGLGWDTWQDKGDPYLRQAADYPLTFASSFVPVHNAFLGYAAELGLIGVFLWAATLVWGVAEAVMRRGPPELAPYRALALAILLFDVIILNFQPGQGYANLLVWVFPAVALAPRFWSQQEATYRAPVPARPGALRPTY